MPDKSEIRNDCLEIKNQDQSRSVIDIKSSTLSERRRLGIRKVVPWEVTSEIQIESNVNYEDLCGPWVYAKNPVYQRYIEPPTPNLCIWIYFTEEDVIYLKTYQKEKQVVLSFFESKFSNENKGRSTEYLVEILWEFFKFVRLHSFTEKGISALLGLVYLTHSFFLSHPWWKAEDVYQFVRETILLHAVLNPPESLEVFTVDEIKLLFKAFHEIYMENLVLLHILCHPNYHFTLDFHNSVQENE
ncbi:uncharacterized protein LOC143372294 [Andrena cerasifolii]|uniref:uncharacterized protein LOC143372294 n=1 Tax=Andrena cerasifolii TaxID=2819439 RepID=UPI00403818E9